MSFKNADSNSKLIERLKDTIVNNSVSHAYILEGDSNTDKLSFANSFIKAILCRELPGTGCDNCALCHKVDHGNHEDIFYVEGHGRSMRVKDADIEYVQERLKNKPNEERNIAVISNADTMTAKAQNRFLKTLEEPPEGAVIILLSENTENLAPTIVSRCVRYRLEGSKRSILAEKDTVHDDDAGNIAGMLIKREPFYKIKPEIDRIAAEAETTQSFLDSLENIYGEYLTDFKKCSSYKKEDIYRAIDAIEAARRDVQLGVAKSYALKKLIIEIGG